MRRNALTLPGIPTHLSSWKSEPCLLDLINPTASRPPSPIDSATWSIYSQRPPANPITKKFNNLKSKFDSIVRPQNDYYDKRR
ncbi:hypothetical protein WR25_00736 [Diploscapter pachys]|uniref:Uncharacterized protein n=1 Tax=Diploscapter pachys TaxID=2018661 RepID=A0A2A2LBU8_9BILA|nr:hypothetical protein WR25_10850 [Diploscapter pachys]PAV84641.1 hypothetical protein WR25_00736 [Diploscapter pachys]